MQRKAIYLFVFVWITMPYAYGMDAMEYFNLGLKNRTTHKKIEYFTKALELKPKFAEAYEKRGLLYYFLGQYDRVIEDFQTYIELAPAKAETYKMIGMGYLKSRLYEPAIDNFTQAIELDPELAGAYAYRAESYRLNGDYQNAIVDANRAIEIRGNPITTSDAYRTRAKVFWETGRNHEAYTDHRKALSMDPRIPRSWGSYPPVEYMRSMGLILLIGIAFVLVFGLKLRPPNKKD
ncbi:MAG: tetratricopeptide repeat protein [Desulfobacterales bacterium]|nr:MAG: tetratricopeptide repeat protein [Desulfobacterales bacterium]